MPAPADARRALRDDIDFVLRAFDTIADLARAPQRERVEDTGIRGKGGHADPTGQQALNPSPGHLWLRAFEDLRKRALRLANAAGALVGEPIDACPGCRMIPQDGQRKHKADGRTWHHTCYMRQRRRDLQVTGESAGQSA